MEKFTFHMEDDRGQLAVKGEIYGESIIPFFDDLKFKAVIALLNSIDKQNFLEVNDRNQFSNYILDVEETLNQMKKVNHFQGKMN